MPTRVRSSGQRWNTDLSPRAKQEILRWGNALHPQEACGILLPPDVVVRLPNRVKPNRLKTEAYEVHVEDVVAAVERWMETSPSAVHHLRDFDFVVWHTHPNGFVGPSRRDLRAKRRLYPESPNEPSPDAGRTGASSNFSKAPVKARVRFLVVSLPWGEASFF